MDGQLAPVSCSDSAERLWRLMQRIEFCRHQAELAEASAAGPGSARYRREMAELAKMWSQLAREYEKQDQLSARPVLRRDTAAE